MNYSSKKQINKILASIVSFFVCLSIVISFPSFAAKQNTKQEASVSSTISEKQRLALNMLNYMTVLTAEINASSGSKRYLDDASSIITNINPDKVDAETLDRISSLFDTIEDYQSIITRRKRLDYLYSQNQAASIRSAIPNPVSLLNTTLAGDPIRAVTSALYMAVDAASSYKNYMSEADKKYLQDEWTLEDEEMEALSSSSEELFTYAVKMCSTNNLDGSKVLTIKDAQDFAEFEREESATRKIFFLKSHKSTYEQYSKYWLVLADSYYKKGDYQNCLDAIKKYPNLGIFKYDRDYAKSLTHAISAAKECCEEHEYIKTATEYSQIILDNIENEDWALKYYVAQVYIDLAQRLNDVSYKKKAFKLLRDNINNYLIGEQIAQNKDYISELDLKDSKDTKDKKKENDIKQYNDWVDEAREKELPPAYQPLVINLDLLFALAGEINISEEQKAEIESMLDLVDGPLFYTTQLQNKFSFKEAKSKLPNIEFDKTTIKVNASLLEQGSTIRLEVKNGNSTKTYKKWKLQEVDRMKSSNPSKFIAVYKTKEKGAKKQDYSENSEVLIHVSPPKGSNYETITYHLKYKPGKTPLGIGSGFEVVN